MGKCAEACINKVKVPVLLVRGNAKALLEQHDMPVTQRRGMRTQDSRGNLHDDAPGGHGLNITVCVDGTNLSKKARLLSPYSSVFTAHQTAPQLPLDTYLLGAQPT